MRRFDWRGYVARTAVRRVVWILVGFVVYAATAYVTPAYSQSWKDCRNSSNNCTIQEASISASHSYTAGQQQYPNNTVRLRHDPQNNRFVIEYQAGVNWYWIQPINPHGAVHFYVSGCPAGKPWDEATGQCGNDCMERPALTRHQTTGGNGFSCSGGCKFEMGAGICLGEGANQRCIAQTWEPTGQTCQVGDAPAPVPMDERVRETCVRPPGANYMTCVEPSGRTCVVTARGTRLCHEPGETGTRQTRDGEEAINKQQQGQPTPPPSSQESPTLIGSQSTSTSSTSYNTAIYSGSGNSGDGSDTGQGGRDGGMGGDGSGSGDGEGDSEGGGVGSDAAFDRADGAEGRTLGGVVSAYHDRISNSPFIGAASNFFVVPTGGSCPNWEIPETAFSPAVSMDFWCNPTVDSALRGVGWVVLAIFAFVAFRWALL